jgi:hypothetical protein
MQQPDQTFCGGLRRSQLNRFRLGGRDRTLGLTNVLVCRHASKAFGYCERAY